MRFWSNISGDLRDFARLLPTFAEKAWSRGRAGAVFRSKSHGISVEWDLWKAACHLISTIDVDQGCLSCSCAVPPIMFTINLKSDEIKTISLGNFLALDRTPTARELSVRFEVEVPPEFSAVDVRMLWRLFADEHGWSSKWPWWADGSVGLSDFMRLLFGEVEHTIEVLAVEPVFVPLPEGKYAGIVTLTKEHWRRKRGLFVLRTRRGRLEMEESIPHPGYGDEGMTVFTGVAETSEQMIAQAVESVLHHRRLHGYDRRPSEELH